MPNSQGVAEDSTDANVEARLLSSVEFHILLVDDSEADAAIFAAALQEASTRVRNYWVGSGEEAIQFVQRRGRFEEVRPAKVVVLDLNLPKQNGFDVLREIRADARTKHMPVIIFSTSSNANDVNMAYALGANAYFVKPMSLEMYVSKVRVIVQHWLDFALLPTM
jgi:DNA-binding response OmpR family regulator